MKRPEICPLPLPEILSDSAGKGILVTAVVHGTGQLETRWGQHGAATIWATCGTKVMFGGISDASTLEHASRLCGQVSIAKGDARELGPALPPELLRTLPPWRALVLRMNLRPVVVKIRPVWKRTAHRFGRGPVPVPVLRPGPVPLRVVEVPAPASDGAVLAAQPGNGSNGHHA